MVQDDRCEIFLSSVSNHNTQQLLSLLGESCCGCVAVSTSHPPQRFYSRAEIVFSSNRNTRRKIVG